MPYTTASDVCAKLGWTASDAALIAEINAVLGVADLALDAYVQSPLYSETGVTRYYDGHDGNILLLSHFIRNLTSVELLDEDGVVSETLTSYCIKQPTDTETGVYTYLQLRGSRTFSSGVANVKVVGDWGLSTIPEDVKYAVALVVQHIFNLRTVNATLAVDKGFSHEQHMNLAGLDLVPPTAKGIMERFRNRTWTRN